MREAVPTFTKHRLCVNTHNRKHNPNNTSSCSRRGGLPHPLAVVCVCVCRWGGARREGKRKEALHDGSAMTCLVILPPCLGDDSQVSKEGSACGVHVMVHMVEQRSQIHVLLYLHVTQQSLLWY